jgi:hypothetical protein
VEHIRFASVKSLCEGTCANMCHVCAVDESNSQGRVQLAHLANRLCMRLRHGNKRSGKGAVIQVHMVAFRVQAHGCEQTLSYRRMNALHIKMAYQRTHADTGDALPPPPPNTITHTATPVACFAVTPPLPF